MSVEQPILQKEVMYSQKNINTAIREGVSISVYELENRWHARLRTKYTWFTYLSGNLYQILFSLSALVLIYGFIRLLIRKRHRRLTCV